MRAVDWTKASGDTFVQRIRCPVCRSMNAATRAAFSATGDGWHRILACSATTQDLITLHRQTDWI
jgi:hypothetical protein